MLKIEGLKKSFHGSEILSGVDLEIAANEVVGLIGRSGAGKSTLARCLVGLEQPDAGRILLENNAITPGRGVARQQIQYLWQDPTQSLSPFLSAKAAVLETLNGFALGSAASRPHRAEALLGSLGLDRETWARRPHALSGGQCQRVALARSLAAESKVLILDEPLSSLDLVTQIATMELLKKVHDECNSAMLIVSHDLAPLRLLADRIVVLDEGQIVDDLSMSAISAKSDNPLLQANAARLSEPAA